MNPYTRQCVRPGTRAQICLLRRLAFLFNLSHSGIEELLAEWNVIASLGFIWREEKQNDVLRQNNMIYLTIKTQLFNQYFDF